MCLLYCLYFNGGYSHPAPIRSALELLRAVFSPHCSSPCKRMNAHLKTPPSSSWSLQMIMDFRRNPSALPHSPSWTALWLQWSHSYSWATQFLRTWSGTITLSPWWKRPRRGCTSFTSWGSSTCHRSCWNGSTLPSLNPSFALQYLSGSAQLPNLTSEDYGG